jgi:hypothetical protein
MCSIMKTWKIQITRFADVTNMNAFVATRPERARVVFRASGPAELW